MGLKDQRNIKKILEEGGEAGQDDIFGRGKLEGFIKHRELYSVRSTMYVGS